eukprot:TRINITY_DN62006_c0_g1_i1.p1 TRINITY_DN62006_c0_g1~~TRINITY_DN62006_c0_g1_i1.p1  ORF type:complete len:1025 (-),score=129.32 TRINITY_DN62006_c0_g1_i1:206-3280(-)
MESGSRRSRLSSSGQRSVNHAEDYAEDKKLMAALDARTEIPHLLVELRSLGYIEICGKDMGGIYSRLEIWMAETWGCQYAQTELKTVADKQVFRGDDLSMGLRHEGFAKSWVVLADHDRLCDASHDWAPNTPECKCMPCCGGKVIVTAFKHRGDSGENNMGKLTMQLINFMTNTCGWGLHLCNGTNLGFFGQIREQQVKFRAPHPLNLIAPHLMVELRQAGYIEINGPNTNGIIDKLAEWLHQTWKATAVKADQTYCDAKFRCGAFKNRGSQGENNMGMRTMEIVDFMVKTCAWTMITCNGGNFGRFGDIREQQMVFRKDDHVQHGEDHIMVELRDIGYVEVNGLSSSDGIEPYIDLFLRECWHCKEYTPALWERDKFCDRKYTTPEDLFYKDGLTNNIGKLTIELAMYLSTRGWMLMLCSGGHTSSLKSRLNTSQTSPHPGQELYEVNGAIKREQQIKFTKARDGEKADESLLMIEFRAVPKDAPRLNALPKDKFRPSSETRTHNNNNSRALRDWIIRGEYEGLIEVNGLNINGVYQKLESFIKRFMKGKVVGHTPYCDCLFACDVFRQKLAPQCNEFWDGYYCGENNFGKYTMRLCDFLVDHLGEWDLIVCNGNAAERAWMFGGITSLVAREQQLVFRRRPAGRAVFMATTMRDAPLGRPPMEAPTYWKEASCNGTAPHEVVPATAEELQWMQELLDGTYINKVTRDRKGGPLADRFVVVAAVRSEHAVLWDSFALRRQVVADRITAQANAAVESTQACKFWVRGHCKYGEACKYKHAKGSALVIPKTVAACPGLAGRCVLPSGANAANEAFLMHGTNPTSAVAILRTDFKIDLAGASAGTMFGPGAYLAEASSKADEYAQDDKDGTYKGLYAIVVCRALVGLPYVVEKPGNYFKHVVSGDFDCVLGDRERAVGTFREFIFFHEESIFPEYAVFYRREYVKSPEPSAMTPQHEASFASFPPPESPVNAIQGMRPQEYQVVAPRGRIADSHLKVQIPNGNVIDVKLPHGTRLGSIITLQVAPT